MATVPQIPLVKRGSRRPARALRGRRPHPGGWCGAGASTHIGSPYRCSPPLEHRWALSVENAPVEGAVPRGRTGLITALGESSKEHTIMAMNTDPGASRAVAGIVDDDGEYGADAGGHSRTTPLGSSMQRD